MKGEVIFGDWKILQLNPYIGWDGYGASKKFRPCKSPLMTQVALACLHGHPSLVLGQSKAGTARWRSPSNKPMVFCTIMLPLNILYVDEYGILNRQDSIVRLGTCEVEETSIHQEQSSWSSIRKVTASKEAVEAVDSG